MDSPEVIILHFFALFWAVTYFHQTYALFNFQQFVSMPDIASLLPNNSAQVS